MSTEFYNNLYSNEKKVFGEIPSGFVGKILELIRIGSVIDIGAGNGRNSIFLAKNGFKVKAVDNAEVALRLLEKIAGSENLSIETGLIDLNFHIPEVSDFDAIVISFVLHHINNQRALEILNKLKLDSKPGSFHVISTFTSEGDFYKLPKSKTLFYPHPGELKEIYKDWEILFYDEKVSNAHAKKEDGSPMQNLSSHILAKKN